MKKLPLGAAACILVAAPAFAADLPQRTYTKAPEYRVPEPVYDWTGLYIGGHVGGVLAGSDSPERGKIRFLGGLQVGFDRQFASSWVVGSELQASGLFGGNGDGLSFPAGTRVTGKTGELISFTGRIGYAWGPTLLYAKGGSVFRETVGVSAGGLPVAVATDHNHHIGITVGGGLEYMFAPNWSAKVEYQYYTFGDSSFTTGPAGVAGTRFRDDEHTVKLGVNYRFALFR